jgi:hypothetical protein
MNKSSNNINEEINRIKSLFTEERMYGNLISESYTLDDIESKKNELLETLKNWETFNNARGGFGAAQIKKEIDGEIQESITIINGISRSNSCNKKTVKLINEKIEKLKDKKKTAQVRWLLKNSDEDRTYYEKVQAYLENMNTICSDIVPDTTPAPTTPDTTPTPTTPGCEGDCENGEGTKTYKSGNVYVGEFKDGKKNGKGTLKYHSGSVYVGEFKDGKKNGQGKLTKSDGSVYEGEFKDNKFVGEVSDNSDGTDEVEVFKDKGGKYHYAKLPDGTYWYSTDGENWKQQTTQKGMDAIEERINSDKVDSLGNVKISSIDSSYVESGDSNGSDEVDTTVDSEEEAIERITPKPVKTFDTDIEANIGDDVVANFGTGNPEEVVVDESDVTFKGCKKRLTSYIKLAKDGTSMEDAFGDEIDEKEKDIRSCLGKYYNKFEKIGFMKKGKGVYLLKKLWDIDYERNIDGGIEGQKYEIIVNNRSRGKVKRVGKNEYRVISKPNETIFGRDKNFRDGFEEAVFNSLDLPSDENDLIVAGIIQKGPIQWAKLLRKDV